MAEGRLNKELLEMNEHNTAIQNKVTTRLAVSCPKCWTS